MKVAVVGATGAVGRCITKILLGLICKDSLSLFASSARVICIDGHELFVDDINNTDFSGIDLVFFSAGAKVSLVHAIRAYNAGAWVIDNSSAFRHTHPLIVPEINLSKVESRSIISNPNCIAIPLSLTLDALRSLGIDFVSVVTFQSVSGSGNKGVSALENNDHLGVYPVSISENIIPKIDDMTSNGFTKEEAKIDFETRKILGADINISATAVRVPVKRGHSMSVHLRFNESICLDLVHKLFSDKPHLSVYKDLLTPKTHVEMCPGAMVSRVRLEPNDSRGLLYWVVSDNLLKGAALNAVQIAQGIGLIREFDDACI